MTCFILLGSPATEEVVVPPPPEGTYPIRLSAATQELLEVVAKKDLHTLETLKAVKIDLILKDLRDKGTMSDFEPLREHITVRLFTVLPFIAFIGAN